MYKLPAVDTKTLRNDNFTVKTFDKKPSVFDQADQMFKLNSSRYEVSYSPERSTMLENLKQRRQMKLTARKQNSNAFNKSVPVTTKNVS